MHKVWLSLGPVCFALMATGLILPILFGNQKTEFEHAAIDSETSIQVAMYQGVKIHGYDVFDVPPMLKGWQQRGGQPFVLMLGNSQLHAINQMRPSDKCVSLENLFGERIPAKSLWENSENGTSSLLKIHIAPTYSIFTVPMTLKTIVKRKQER